jgi:hypothetical protein
MAVEPFTLWQLARQVSPCRWSAYNRWFDIEDTGLSEAAVHSIETAIARRYPKLQPWQRTSHILKAQEKRAEILRFRARDLLISYLPNAVKAALQSGRYSVRAKKKW